MADERRNGERGRRRSDRYVNPRENWYRDLLLLIGLALLVVAILVARNADDHAGRADRTAIAADREAISALRRVQEGRRTSITVTCAALSAISAAGRDVITGPLAQRETPFTLALERLGYPPLRTRRAQARHAASLYVGEIASRVNRELAQVGHGPIPGLLRANGTIDCGVLQRVSAVPTPR